MNKYLKDGIVIGLLGAIGFSSYIGYKVYKVNQLVDTVTLEIDSFNKNIPKPFSATHNLVKGTFQSNGEYIIKIEENNDFAAMKLTYDVDHGIKSILAGEYPIIGNIEIYDNKGLIEKLKIDKNIMDVKGMFLNNGDINLKGTTKAINLKEKIGFDLDASTLEYNYNAKTKYLNGMLNIPSVTHALGAKFKNISLTKDFSTEDILLGKGKATIEEIQLPYGLIKNLTTEYFSEMKNEKYNLGINLNIGEAQTIFTNQNKINANFNFGVKDIDRIFIDKYNKLLQERNNNNQNFEEKLSQIDIERLFKKGFSFHVNNISYSDGQNIIKGKGMLKFNEQEEKTPLDVRKNTQFKVILEGKGDMVEVVKSIYPQKYDYFKGQPEKEAKLEVLFTKNKLFINNINAPEEDLEKANQVFDEITERIKDMK